MSGEGGPLAALRSSSQNRSTAVMQRRKVAPHSLDYFPTPPWASRALCEYLKVQAGDLGRFSVWEPACGEGHMAKVLLEHFGSVRMSDVHRYRLPEGLGDHELLDFAFFGADEPKVDFVISNPPFRLAEAFIASAAKVARRGYAMLVRSAFLEGQERFATLWATNPPSVILQFTERVVMLEGRLVQSGALDPFAEKENTKASTATSYVWLVWFNGWSETLFEWIPPSRHRLEKRGDYPDYATEILPPPADGLFGQEAA